MRTKIQII